MDYETENFEHLEGKEIKWDGWDTVYNAIPVLIDYEMGITIVEKEDKTRNLTCLNKSEFPNDNALYREIFGIVIDMIKSGTYDGTKVSKLLRSRGRLSFGTEQAPCAFY